MKDNMKKDDLLSQAQIRELFQYETVFGNLIWKVDCYANKVKGQVAGTITKYGYRNIHINSINYRAHRLVWKYHNGEIPLGFQIDHINRDRLDNRIENLCLKTPSGNSNNRTKIKECTSRFLGVNWNKNEGKWVVRTTSLDKIRYFHGYFVDEITAGRVAETNHRKIKKNSYNELDSVNNILINEIQKM